jgi:hypothetical protein
MNHLKLLSCLAVDETLAHATVALAQCTPLDQLGACSAATGCSKGDYECYCASFDQKATPCILQAAAGSSQCDAMQSLTAIGAYRKAYRDMCASRLWNTDIANV